MNPIRSNERSKLPVSGLTCRGSCAHATSWPDPTLSVSRRAPPNPNPEGAAVAARRRNFEALEGRGRGSTSAFVQHCKHQQQKRPTSLTTVNRSPHSCQPSVGNKHGS